jgi:hypothetical protein
MNEESIQKTMKGIAKFCNSHRYTFIAKYIVPYTGYSSHKIGNQIIPELIKKGYVSVYSTGSGENRYKVEDKLYDALKKCD